MSGTDGESSRVNTSLMREVADKGQTDTCRWFDTCLDDIEKRFERFESMWRGDAADYYLELVAFWAQNLVRSYSRYKEYPSILLEYAERYESVDNVAQGIANEGLEIVQSLRFDESEVGTIPVSPYSEISFDNDYPIFSGVKKEVVFTEGDLAADDVIWADI